MRRLFAIPFTLRGHDGMPDSRNPCRSADGETRTRTGDTTIFSRVLMRLKHAHMQGRRTRQERPHRTE